MKKLLTAVAVTGLSFGAFAADEQDYTQWVTLTNSDNKSGYSYNKATNWDDGAAPSKGKKYYVPSGHDLWTTSSSLGNSTFAGDALAMAGEFRIRATTGGSTIKDLRALPGGSVYFCNNSGRYIAGTATVETTEAAPFAIHASITSGTVAEHEIRADFIGPESAAVVFYQGSVSVPVRYTAKGSWSAYLGSLTISNKLELVLKDDSTTAFPGTLRLSKLGVLTDARHSGETIVGTLEVRDSSVVRYAFDQQGEVSPLTVTDALTFVDGAKFKVQFAEWYPKSGVQKYPILKLTGTAADSAVTADDFILDIASPMWMGLPKTDNPRIAIDETADGTIVSVEWPDEPEPFTYLDESGNLVLDAATQYGNFVDGISDGDSPLFVIKKGEGVAQIGPNSPFTGTLDVREGKLIVGNPA